jgi:hypothetical protein
MYKPATTSEQCAVKIVAHLSACSTSAFYPTTILFPNGRNVVLKINVRRSDPEFYRRTAPDDQGDQYHVSLRRVLSHLMSHETSARALPSGDASESSSSLIVWSCSSKLAHKTCTLKRQQVSY